MSCYAPRAPFVGGGQEPEEGVCRGDSDAIRERFKGDSGVSGAIRVLEVCFRVGFGAVEERFGYPN